MKKNLYVIMQNCGMDLGEGYSSWSGNEFLGIVTSFETARNIIEYLADTTIGEKNPNYPICKNCQKSFCGGCVYDEHSKVTDDDWNNISLEGCDYVYDSNIDYHFCRVEVEV